MKQLQIEDHIDWVITGTELDQTVITNILVDGKVYQCPQIIAVLLDKADTQLKDYKRQIDIHKKAISIIQAANRK